MPMTRIGLIANPVSARDVRRVISHAAGLTLGERVGMLLRILHTLAACGVDEVLLMPEREGLRAMLARQLHSRPVPRLRWLEMPVQANTGDSTRAARLMQDEQVACIIVLGGDGTHRAVAKGCGNVPIVAISSGTNNAFPPMREVTPTAFAAGLFATRAIPHAVALQPRKSLQVTRYTAGGEIIEQDLALVDVGILNERLLGARAIGRADTLRTVVVTQASVESVGLSALVAMLEPLASDAPGGRILELSPPEGPGAPVRHHTIPCADGPPSEAPFQLQAALAPGLLTSVTVLDLLTLDAGQPYVLRNQSGLLALDGEREMLFLPDERIEIALKERAIQTLDVGAVLRHAARHHLTVTPLTSMAAQPDPYPD
ncbi:MAG: NAD(+)/NADH kinase [Lautropia sp.]|nr:NAD(+)/NADH kinase [Lautropia sp.]